jgi:2,2-dialkylglycine decarboxylase (pyruvate)
MEKACTGALHLFSGMLSPPVVELSRRLTSMLPPSLSKAMFLSTGGEANEAALKLAEMHTGKFEVVGFTGAWHGMTSGAQSVNYFAGRKGYGPMMPGSLTLPVPHSYRCPVRHCRDACDGTCIEVGFDMVDAESTGSLAALIAEPVESAGGVVVPPDGYWQKVKQHCERRGMLLVLHGVRPVHEHRGDRPSAIWRIAPPLTVSAEEIDRGIAILDQAITDVLAAGASKLRSEVSCFSPPACAG